MKHIMKSNQLGNVSNSALRRWTECAIMCYERGCICENCIMNNRFESSKCRMKTCVIELVKKLGAPNANG